VFPPGNQHHITKDKNKSLHLRHIVTPGADIAKHVLGRLREAEDFSKLASEFSPSPFNLNGGYIGPFSPNKLMPGIAEKIVPLAPLSFSPVLETSSGFHIFQKFMVYNDLLKPN
jgi:parvulin-like peptidyl-prolyl isomerase